ncbi:uncharacterized protein [Palaemon carinicauda]|uniref:uncharacterized protein n=1 Tax=Palaemon carinicauda TaxID=392227 RepID=UPI0035B6972F
MQHPLAYMLKKLKNHQRCYSTIEKEALALLNALEHFEYHLSGSPAPILVFTDHEPLKFVRDIQAEKQSKLKCNVAVITVTEWQHMEVLLINWRYILTTPCLSTVKQTDEKPGGVTRTLDVEDIPPVKLEVTGSRVTDRL